MVAGQDLCSLVHKVLFGQHGTSRWTSYPLEIPRERLELKTLQADEEKILAFVRERGSITNRECRTLLAVNEARAYYLLKTLASSGQLKSEGTGRWRRCVLLIRAVRFVESGEDILRFVTAYPLRRDADD